MHFRLLLTLLCLMLAGSTSTMADTPQRATHTRQAYQIGLGPTQVLDTYLSQEKFSGTGFTFLSATERYGATAQEPDRWHTLIQHQLSLASVDDASGSRDELQGDYALYVGRLRHWQACTWHDGRSALGLEAGAMLSGNLGFIYNTTGSNNPAQARLSVGVMPVAAANGHLDVFRRRLTARYELALPLLGVAFSPNYGQSYYELFSLGNYDHNIVPTTFVSAPNFRQQLTIDYRLWRNASLRLGYLGDYQQLRVNNLKSHVYHHRIMVGYVRDLTHIKATPK